MPGRHEVHVIHRNLRWEVSVDGVTRPLVDWFFSKDRALESALSEAVRLEARHVGIEAWDGTVEERISLVDGPPGVRVLRAA